jgi:predicted nucleic acid-binding protein
MIALDATFLVDYLDGVDDAKAFVEDRGAGPYHAPTLALFEVERGALRAGGRDALDAAVDALDWIEPLPLTASGAREAALVEHELRDDGAPVNLGDALIAGICRDAGARIVTRDGDFERIDGLDVVAY